MNRKVMLIAVSILVGMLMFGASALAQVTTSALRGHVTGSADPLVAATVSAVHTPSGTKYNALTDADGNFFINNMRVGGPYTVTVTYIGYNDHVTDGINLVLGETFVMKVNMSESSELLEGVTVTAEGKNPTFNSQRTGALTQVSSEQLKTLPTISRSLNDFTRLTPQANGSSFAGRDGRMNNISIDGGAFRNNFGLSNNLMPGGSAQPISLDAIEAVSVNIAPYDVRLSGFTGASVNAITKSGTNIFNGTAYTFLRGNGMTGIKVGDKVNPDFANRHEQTYGFTLGGPIVKDKLFFFVSGEYEKAANPYTGFYPSSKGVADKENNLSRTSIADMKRMKDFLMEKYGYDPGSYETFPSLDSKNYKFLVKLDWNISQDHHLSLRYNYLKNQSMSTTNYNSGPGNNPRLNPGRISEGAMAFSNSWYGNVNEIHGFAGELNSRFGDNISNKLMVTYTGSKDPMRTSPSAEFPFVDILKDGGYYMSFGYELFSYHNQVVNNTLSISDDFTYNLGNHTLVAGLRYDNIYVNNGYFREGTSYYRYASMEDFMNNAKPIGFGVTYGWDGKELKGVEMNFGLFAAYFQDEWAITPQFKLTPGLRVEVPMYLNKLVDNPQVTALGDMRYGTKMDVGTWPNTQVMWNPRLGFNWDILGDRSIQLRGGTGLFSGLLPFVWFTNQPSASGTLQSPEMGFSGDMLPDDFRFNPDFHAQIKNYSGLFPQTFSPDATKPYKGALAQVAKDFKMPQVWRSNLAFDFALPYNTTLTLEGIYSKDVFAPLEKNVNLPEPTGQMVDGRPYYQSDRIHKDVNNAILLTNTDKGYQASFTAQIKNRAVKGLDFMLAYTYTTAMDVTSNPGSSANSAWTSNPTYSDLNDPELSYSSFAVPHRLVGSISYRLENKNMATTIGLYYNGSNTGRSSFITGDYRIGKRTFDLNGDGSTNDLLYVPESTADTKMTFVDKKDKSGNVVMSAADQYKAFMTFVDGNDYLKTRKGKFAERNGLLDPWLNRFDLKVMHEFFTDFGTDRRYTLQFSFDMINFGNLLNSNWGVYKRPALSSSYNNIMPLQIVSVENGTTPLYNLRAGSLAEFAEKANAWDNDVTVSSTWGLLFGVKLIF